MDPSRLTLRRHSWLIGFHWVTALLVAASFAIAWLHESVEDLAVRAFWLDVHRSIGFAVLALTLVRFAIRASAGPVSARSDLSTFEWLASRTTHLAIYALLVAMPLIGWAQSSAKVRHLRLFGVPVPALVHHDRDLGDALAWWHEQLGWVLFGLILLHALAGLYHHYVRKDDLLRRMAPPIKLSRRRDRDGARLTLGQDHKS